MQVAILSDIHGNAKALKAVLNDLAEKNVKKLYIIGDLCYRGPEPKNALETVRSTPAKVLKGNADEWIVRGVKKGEVPDKALAIMNQEREWTVERLTQDDIAYLENLPTSFHENLTKEITMHLFHATPDSLFEIVSKEASDEELEHSLMTQVDADFYIYGHIHTPFVRKIGDKTVINTGSVGLPFDGDNRASYALLTIKDGKAEAAIERVEYDINRVAASYDANDYPNREQMKQIIISGKKPS